MLCHIMFESDYSYHYHNLIDHYFDISEHFFLVIGRAVWDNDKHYVYQNSLVVESLSDYRIKEILEKSQAIILHGLFFRETLNLLYRNPQYLSKTNWLIWGGDAYDYPDSKFSFYDIRMGWKCIFYIPIIIAGNLYNSLKNDLVPFTISSTEIKRIFVIKRFRNIIGICYEDYLSVKEIYDTNCSYIYGFYPLLVNWNLIDAVNYNLEFHNTSDTLNILLGNSASETNRHLEAFEYLKKFKNDNVNIYCPLSYGDTKYKDRIIKIGYDIFEEKFIPITKMMSSDEYIEFLSQIDIAVMNHNRQQGLGNIFTLMLLGKKVYMPSNIQSYSLLKKKNCCIYYIKDLEHCSNIDDLTIFPEKNKINNQKVIKEEFSENTWSKVWSKIFLEIIST